MEGTLKPVRAKPWGLSAHKQLQEARDSQIEIAEELFETWSASNLVKFNMTSTKDLKGQTNELIYKAGWLLKDTAASKSRSSRSSST